MLRFFTRKILIFVFSLFFVTSLTFFLMKSIPGDPFLQEKFIPKEILDSLRAHYGLDQPLLIQYGKYMKGIVTWNLGPSFVYEGRTVNEIIGEGFPVSALLGLEALFLSLFFGILFGSIAAMKKGSKTDHFFSIFALIGISVPSFLLATLLQYLFALKLGLFPIARWGTFLHTVLPAFALAAMPTAFIAKLVRVNLIEVLQQDYIKMAYAKGLSSVQIVMRHALRNAMLPVLAYLGPLMAQILTGSFVVEKIFGIPGLGQWLILSISNRDYTLILGLTIFFSFLLMSIIFAIDLVYEWVDPRIRLNHSSKSRIGE
ncbi:MAG: ABC transporter permease [Chlamydiota bacterium]